MTESLSVAALLTGAAITVVASLTIGIASAGRRAGLVHSRTLAAFIMLGLVMWLGMTAALAGSGVLADWSAMPPRWPLLPLSALLTLIFLGRTQTFKRLMSEIPRWQPVALQTFRVAVELAFWRLHTGGDAPIQVTFEGRNFDALVGLTAPFVAFGIARGWIGRRLTIGWNVLGLALLFNAIGTVATSAPGFLHLDWPGEPFRAIATWPVIWIPAIFAPTAIFLHVTSIRQALDRQAIGSQTTNGIE